MNGPVEFDLLNAPLDGRSLIEASAGTGKTYALAGLFLRFVIEKNLPVSDILAVTFTEAAAEELRGRIHSLLRFAKQYFEHSGPKTVAHDPLLSALLSKCDKPASRDAVVAALRDFDACSIFTIHGFCQRLLYEFAFESDQLLNAELITDQSGFVGEIVEDFWREHFSNSSFSFTAYAVGRKIFPEELVKLVDLFVNHDDARIIPETSAADTTEAETAFLGLFARAGELWKQSRSDIAGLLQSDSLDGRKYGKSVRTSLLTSLDSYLSGTTPDPAALEKYEKLTTRMIDKSIKKGSPAVGHSFFDVCESLLDSSRALCNLFDRRILHLKAKLMFFLRRELETRKRRENVLFFDDLLLQVRRTLSNKNAGAVLVNLIRKKYRAVLIDEFQDTDPLQCGIFFDLFSKDTILFLIGDPKQAIYGFRGADIFAYLKASKKVDKTYTLSTNYRSEKRIVAAINTLFRRSNAFVFDDIKYRPIAASVQEKKFSLQDHENSRFILWFVERNDNHGSEVAPLSKSIAEPRASMSVVSEISWLLNSPDSGMLRFNGRKISPNDIAVLVRSNREADLIYNLLINNGIAATIQGNKNVFETSEAMDLYHLLMGMTNVLHLDALRAALCTCYIGCNAFEINRLNTNQAELDQRISVFSDYHELWKNAGFMRMIRFFMAREKVRIRLLSMPLGERKLTNLLHLLELIHHEESSKKTNPKNICKWLLNKILQDSSHKSEEEVLRLEKDDNAIRIMTLHKSKGLEFPIVFCPFAWEGSELEGNRKNKPFLFHDPDDNYLQKIALGEEEINRLRSIAEQEQLAENIRLLYVGLTRAKFRCYSCWGMVSKAETSAFAYLLHGNDETSSVQALGARLKGMSDDMLRKEIQSVVNDSENSIEADNISIQLQEQSVSTSNEPLAIAPRDFTGTIAESWHITSFSSITRFHGFEDHPIDLEPVEYAGEKKSISPNSPEDEELNIFAFPRGKNAGSFLHDLLEHVDFADIDTCKIEKIILTKLDEYGFESKWFFAINSLINRLIKVPLIHDKGNFALSMIPGEKCLREMEFIFPMNRISSQQLNDIFANTKFGNPVFKERKFGNLDFSPVQGFLKGFIDLIFEHDDRYFIIDWKSNFLGDTVDQYNYQSIKDEMIREYYYVQYYIYLVALNEFLSKRLSNYDYNKHFGGVFYIFLRGIDTEKGQNGIFFDRPDEESMKMMRDCLISKR